MNILKAVNLRKIYGQGETEVRALDGINLEVEKRRKHHTMFSRCSKAQDDTSRSRQSAEGRKRSRKRQT